jgi:hypothetical protein
MWGWGCCWTRDGGRHNGVRLWSMWQSRAWLPCEQPPPPCAFFLSVIYHYRQTPGLHRMRQPASRRTCRAAGTPVSQRRAYFRFQL